MTVHTTENEIMIDGWFVGYCIFFIICKPQVANNAVIILLVYLVQWRIHQVWVVTTSQGLSLCIAYISFSYKVMLRRVELLMKLHLTAMEHHLPHGITVLPSTQHKWTHPAVTPARQAGTRFSYHGGMEGWVDHVHSWHQKFLPDALMNKNRHQESEPDFWVDLRCQLICQVCQGPMGGARIFAVWGSVGAELEA